MVRLAAHRGRTPRFQRHQEGKQPGAESSLRVLPSLVSVGRRLGSDQRPSLCPRDTVFEGPSQKHKPVLLSLRQPGRGLGGKAPARDSPSRTVSGVCGADRPRRRAGAGGTEQERTCREGGTERPAAGLERPYRQADLVRAGPQGSAKDHSPHPHRDDRALYTVSLGHVLRAHSIPGARLGPPRWRRPVWTTSREDVKTGHRARPEHMQLCWSSWSPGTSGRRTWTPGLHQHGGHCQLGAQVPAQWLVPRDSSPLSQFAGMSSTHPATGVCFLAFPGEFLSPECPHR